MFINKSIHGMSIKRYKIIISILFGIAGLTFNFIPVSIYQYQGLNITILLGLIFPLFIAVAWGWKYGLISATMGVFQSMLFVWYTGGYGALYAALMIVLWIAWHGVMSDYRSKTGSKKWYHSIYITELTFRILCEIGYCTIFPWLVALNPPYWDSTITTTIVSPEWMHVVVLKHIFVSFLFLFVVSYLLKSEYIRRIFKIDDKDHRDGSGKEIIFVSILVACVLIIVDAVACTVFSKYNQMNFIQNLFNFSVKEMFIRSTMTFTCMIFGIIIYVFYNKNDEKKRLIQQAYHDIEAKNDELLCSRDELLKNEQRFRTYIDKAPYGIFISDEKGVTIDVNEQACNITGYAKNELISMNLQKLMLSGDMQIAQEKYQLFMHNEQRMIAEETSDFITKKGETRKRYLKVAKLDNNHLIGFVEDITDREADREKVDYLLKYDVLTGLYNKSYLYVFMESVTKGRQSYPISIIYTDINGMRAINEQYGNKYGDKIIIKLGEILKRFFKPGVVFKEGGDSFIIVLPGTGLYQCERMLSSLQEVIKKEVDTMSTAFGCATLASNDVFWEDTMRLAEQRMYASKILQKDSQRSLVINSFMKALSERSFETEEHVQRIKNVAEKIAITMGLERYVINNILIAAQFHDIGKIGIPDSILFKPCKLTDDEWIVMKKHCKIGYRIMSAASDMTYIAKFVLSHHERWDGKGYPKGLSGNKIPIESRIIAVADTFDAMTNDRVYRNKASHHSAFEEIKRCAGTQFDPNVTRAFLEAFEHTIICKM